MRRVCLRVVLSALGLSLAGVSQAGPMYAYAFDRSNYTVAPGGTVTVKVFLQEDDTSGGSAFLNDPGLIGAGVLVHFNDLTATQPATVVGPADILPASADFPGPPGPFLLFNPGDSAGFSENVGLGAPVMAPFGGPIYQLFLGEFLFTAGHMVGDVTHLRATRTAADSQDDVGADFPPTVLDPLLQDGAATITVSGSPAGVPEPASLVLLGIGAALLVCRSRRK